MTPTWRDTAFTDAVLAESVRWIEQAGPLDDGDANRSAVAEAPDGAGRIAHRARTLGHRLDLQGEWMRLRRWAPWVLLALVGLVVVAGLGVVGNVVGGGDRRINVMVALVSLLGLHAVTMLLWLIGLFMPAGSLHASLGGLWLALTARVAGGRRGQAPVLVRATTGLLQRARLTPWALGFVSHTIWALSFAVVLAALLFALAFRNYTLSWETTILDPAFFVDAVRWLGLAPSWLGFPIPDAATVLAPAADLAGQRRWALWLTGCVVVYGLLPRVLLAVLSASVWHARKGRLRPDLGEPYYRKLVARFEALQPPDVVDADPGQRPQGAAVGLSAGRTHDALWLIGFELPDESAWPPADMARVAARTLRVDGSAAQRGEALDALAQARPARVVLTCHAASSPDRGTERFVREVQARCGECRLWLMGEEADTGRWERWLEAAGLRALRAERRAGDALEGWT